MTRETVSVLFAEGHILIKVEVRAATFFTHIAVGVWNTLPGVMMEADMRGAYKRPLDRRMFDFQSTIH